MDKTNEDSGNRHRNATLDVLLGVGPSKKMSCHLKRMTLAVKKSKIRGAGLGLFANMDFPADAVLGEYWGVRTTTKPADGRYVWHIDTDDGSVYIDAAQNDCPLRFVNGAKTERQHERINCKTYISHGALLYVTTRAVKAGEELIIDYGPYYWACDCERCRPNRKNSRSTSRKISRVANRGDRINVAFATIDLFAGVGGFSLGAAAAGARVILAVEACPKIAALHTLNLPLKSWAANRQQSSPTIFASFTSSPAAATSISTARRPARASPWPTK